MYMTPRLPELSTGFEMQGNEGISFGLSLSDSFTRKNQGMGTPISFKVSI